VVGTASVLSLVEHGFGKIVFSSKGKIDPASNFGAFLVSDEFVRKYPQATHRVLAAFLRAAHFASSEQNRNELYEIWARAGQSRAAVARDYDGDSLRDRASPLLDDFFVANVTRGVKFAIDNKLIKQGFDIEAWIDRKSFNDCSAVPRLRKILVASRFQRGAARLRRRADGRRRHHLAVVFLSDRLICNDRHPDRAFLDATSARDFAALSVAPASACWIARGCGKLGATGRDGAAAAAHLARGVVTARAL